METRANYIVVGLFVIGLGACFILAILWFSAGQHKNYNEYLVFVNESVAGLNEQAPVRFNGVDVGYVADIEIDKQDPQKIRLLLKIAVDTPINQSTRATLMKQGITGITYIGLKADRVDAPPLKKSPGFPFPIILSEPSLLMRVDTALRTVTQDIKAMNKSFQELLSEQNQQAIREILDNAAKFSNTLAKNDDAIAQGLKSTANLSQGLAQQAMPSTVESLNRLTNVLTDIEQLTNTLKTNPSVLIRGEAPLPRGPGE